jgi:two-component system cell cycle sensor histidine kinase/response regulator CckA
MLNLAVNACDAVPQGGTLSIETANVGLDEHNARPHIGVTLGPYVLLAMTDTAMGMDAEIQAHIFEPPFFHGGHR